MSTLISSTELRAIAYNSLKNKLDVRTDVASAVADGLVWTSLRGIDSHGIRLLPHYIKGIKAGRLNPNPNILFRATSPTSGLLDADDTFGHFAGTLAIKNAIDLARKSGFGAVSVSNSSHCGALSYFCHSVDVDDMILMAFTHATPRVKSPGSNRPFFGNNPFCFVAPMAGEAPFCFDAATTTTTFNAVRAALADGKTLPPGLVADINGVETNDPSKAVQLLPIGDYKGFGISMIVDILCAILSGMPNGDHVSEMFSDNMHQKRKLGQFYCALKIDSFRDTSSFVQDLTDMANRLRSEPAIDLSYRSVMVPGDPEKRMYEKRLVEGIPVPENFIHQVS